jgi:hypothetical protein
VFCPFLALVLKSELEQRIAALGRDGSWSEILADLDSLTETEIVHDGQRFLVRSAPRPAAVRAVRAALPPSAPPCRRPRRPATARSGPRRRLIPTRECSATLQSRRRSPFAFSYLAKATVEDGVRARLEADALEVRGTCRRSRA